MPSPRTDIDPHVSPLLLEGETALTYSRRKIIMAALREKFPDTSPGTLNSAIVRVLRKRREGAQGKVIDD